MSSKQKTKNPALDVELEMGESKLADACPYCGSKDFVKRGSRQKKYETVQLYLCRGPECGRTFTAQSVKGKHWPLKIIIEGMSYYNLGYNLEETSSILRQKFGLVPSAFEAALAGDGHGNENGPG